MKRIFSYLAACATMFALAACQEKPIEQPVVETPEVEVEYQDVTFSVAAPSGPQTRTSYGETVTFPTELHVAVYVAEGNEKTDKVGTWLKDVKSVIVPKAEGEGVINTEWEVTISLVKSYSYDIVFWAQKEESTYYTINWEKATITADYEVAANDVTRDAFYHVAKGYNYITATEDDARIQLTRPFAQINLGASDYAALIEHSGFVNGTADPDLHTTITSVTATIPDVLNVLTSEATGNKVVKFAVAPTTELVKDENDIKVTGTNAAGVEETMNYKLVGSNYILANPYKENNPTVELDLTFEYNGKSFDLNVPNVPYARNYQTNILGNFFTSNSKFNVVIVPGFNTIPGDEYVHVWDGYSVSEPVKGAEGYMVTTGAELAWVAQQVNTGAKDFAGETVIIAEEIRLAGYPWTPIGNDQYPFKGTIKSLEIPVKSAAAAHYSISGLYVKRAEGPAGLFGVLNGTASYLTFDAPEVYGTEYVGTVAGKIFPEGLIEGVAINGGKVTGNHYVGGAVGYAYGSVKSTVIDGLEVSGVYVDEDLDGAKIGGVIGFHPIDADDTEVSGNVIKSLGIAGKREVGAIAGAANAKNIKGNDVESATIEADDTYSVGVVVGRAFNDEGEEVTLDPRANTYVPEGITVNGDQPAPAKYFELDYNPEVTLIPAEGGEITIKIVSNVNAWSVTAPEGVKVEPAEGKETADVVFTFPENKSIEPVTYELVFENHDEACAILNCAITVTQEAGQPEEPEVPVLTDGTYWIVSGTNYATPLTSKYGYIKVDTDGYVDNAFKFTAVNGGYTIQDAAGKYYYQTGTYDSFNVTTDKPTEGAVWNVAKNDDGTYVITNVSVNKSIQYDTQYNSYGSYADVRGLYPTLVDASAATIRPVLTLSETTKTVEADAKEYTFTVNANVEWTATPSAGVTLAVEGSNVTMKFDANTAEEAVVYTVKVAGEGLEATFTLTQKGVPAPDQPEVVGGGSDDFNTISSTNTSYVSGKTTAGWNYKNCAIFKGGTSDSSPAFKMIGDASNRALCMNGKTSAVGTITSPTISGGCGTLTFDYGLPFSDTKIKFRVDIIQNGATVKTFTVENSSATKLTKYSHEEVVDVAGEFQIVFTNLSPSNSTSNKDRTAVWNVVWTGCAK